MEEERKKAIYLRKTDLSLILTIPEPALLRIPLLYFCETDSASGLLSANLNPLHIAPRPITTPPCTHCLVILHRVLSVVLFHIGDDDH